MQMNEPESRPPGQVALVGAGPGAADLLTLRAARLIADAEAVVYDHLVGSEIVELIPAAARRVYAGKESGHHALSQEEINRLLIRLGREGLRVVRLKGGDPFIFGRGGEEMAALEAAGIACEIVPGITSAAGAGAATGMPLTHREHAQTLVLTTGHLKNGAVDLDWDALARPGQTVVIYMGLAALETICAEMVAHGLPENTPAAVVRSATGAQQRTVAGTLGNLAQRVRTAELQPPALIMIGETVAFYDPRREAAMRRKVGQKLSLGDVAPQHGMVESRL